MSSQTPQPDGPPVAAGPGPVPGDGSGPGSHAGSVPRSAEPSGSELGRAARGGAVTFVGAASSSGLGFLFSLLLARLWGTTDAGVVLQTVALFTITVSVARLGMDTTAVWLLPRLRATDPAQVPGVMTLLLVSAAVAGAVLALGWLPLRRLWPADDAALIAVVDAVVWVLPIAAVTAVALSCTRAFGGILAFNAVDTLLIPLLRPIALVGAHVLAVGVVGAALGWALPVVAGCVVVSVVLHRSVAGLRAGLPPGTSVPRWPGRDLRTQIARYSVPRTFAAAMEQSIVWIGVLLVGLIAGDAAAGIYGSSARFVAAGVVVATALRIVIAPRFSALLAQRRTDEVAELYVVTARWILLFGAPVYLTLAFFAPTVLGWLGEGFASGVHAMTILCLGSVVVLAAGNVQSLLLMSGRSGLGALNKAVVLVVNVVGNLVLVPEWGIEAAAAVWSFSMLLDTVLASIQVRRATGISLAWASVLRVVLAVTACVALPAWAVTALWGQGNAPLVVSIGAGGVLLLAYCLLDRRVLHLDDLRSMVRR